jgi:hypothetical protein
MWRGIERGLEGYRLTPRSIVSQELVVPVMPPHIRGDVERPQTSGVGAGISYDKKKRYMHGTDASKDQLTQGNGRGEEMNDTHGALRYECGNEL